MVTEVAAAVSERPTTTSECEEPMPYAPEVPMPTQKTGQRLVTALLSWWPIYTPHPGYFEFAGVPRHLIHTQEHLQALQELIDHILRF